MCSVFLVLGMCSQVLGEDSKTNIARLKLQKTQIRFIESIVESWEYAAIFKLSPKGDVKLLTKIQGGNPPRGVILGKRDYDFYRKIDNSRGDLYYLLLIFKVDQRADPITATSRVKISKQIVILGWGDYDYKKDLINLSSLTEDNQGDGFCKVGDLIKAEARLRKRKTERR